MGVRLPAALAVTAVLLAGCSGGGGGERSSDALRGSSTTGAPATTVGGTSLAGTAFSGAGSEEYCRLASSYDDAQRRLGLATTPELRATFREAALDLEQSLAVAPEEIRPDVQVVAEVFAALVAALESVDYEFPRLPSDLIGRMLAEDFTTAADRVLAYGREVCGLAG